MLVKESKEATRPEEKETVEATTMEQTSETSVKQAAKSTTTIQAPPLIVPGGPLIVPGGNGKHNDRIKASPLAKTLAKEKDIDLSLVQGSGDNNRIIKKDIEVFLSTGSAASFIGEEGFEDVAVSQMRKTIAKRLSESKFAAPHFYLTMEIDMGKAMEARESINKMSPVKISFNDLIVKAAAISLRKHPKVNASWLVDKISLPCNQ